MVKHRWWKRRAQDRKYRTPRRFYIDYLKEIERCDGKPETQELGNLYMQERDTYGFDRREILYMDTALITWIYEHVCMYEEWAYRGNEPHKVVLEYRGHRHSQAALLKSLRQKCLACLKPDKDKRWHDDYYRQVTECIELFTLVLPSTMSVAEILKQG